MVWGMEEKVREFSVSARAMMWVISFTPLTLYLYLYLFQIFLTCLIHMAFQHKPYADIRYKLSSMAN
jgi:hypothetical protein